MRGRGSAGQGESSRPLRVQMKMTRIKQMKMTTRMMRMNRMMMMIAVTFGFVLSNTTLVKPTSKLVDVRALKSH